MSSKNLEQTSAEPLVSQQKHNNLFDEEDNEIQFIKKQLENIEHYKLGYNAAQTNLIKLFETERDAIKWVSSNILLFIKPKNKSNTFSLVSPFSSLYAHKEVVENLGKELFAYQQSKTKP